MSAQVANNQSSQVDTFPQRRMEKGPLPEQLAPAKQPQYFGSLKLSSKARAPSWKPIQPRYFMASSLLERAYVLPVTVIKGSMNYFSIRPVAIRNWEGSLSVKTIMLTLLLGAMATFAAPSAKTRTLDTAAIRKTYMDGDFDRAIDDIEIAMKRGGAFSHQDSIFMFKHLGVMHAAKYETREKGRYYMMQLLTVEPTARILDMYASDMIYMIFKNIQVEFEANQSKPPLADLTDTVETVPAKKPPGKRRSHTWLGWTACAVAAAGGIALTLHLVDEPASKEFVGE